MQKLENIDDGFLECLLKAYYRKDKQYVEMLVNYETVKRVIPAFLNYYKNIDKSQFSFHEDIIKKVYGCGAVAITKNNCQAILGISYMTFCRYKQRYFSTLKNYLIQHLEVAATL